MESKALKYVDINPDLVVKHSEDSSRGAGGIRKTPRRGLIIYSILNFPLCDVPSITEGGDKGVVTV